LDLALQLLRCLIVIVNDALDVVDPMLVPFGFSGIRSKSGSKYRNSLPRSRTSTDDYRHCRLCHLRDACHARRGSLAMFAAIRRALI
jgi:hypothetical protein